MPGWSGQTRKRALKAHARKKAARHQRKHLENIKSQAALRQIMLWSRCRQR